jgi:hypothetical protein
VPAIRGVVEARVHEAVDRAKSFSRARAVMTKATLTLGILELLRSRAIVADKKPGD